MSNPERSRPADHVRPLAAYLVRNGAWLIPLAAYALSWALWVPLLGRDMGSAAGLPVDFLAFALAGNVMPGVCILAWHLAGARIPPPPGPAWRSPACFRSGLRVPWCSYP